LQLNYAKNYTTKTETENGNGTAGTAGKRNGGKAAELSPKTKQCKNVFFGKTQTFYIFFCKNLPKMAKL